MPSLRPLRPPGRRLLLPPPLLLQQRALRAKPRGAADGLPVPEPTGGKEAPASPGLPRRAPRPQRLTADAALASGAAGSPRAVLPPLLLLLLLQGGEPALPLPPAWAGALGGCASPGEEPRRPLRALRAAAALGLPGEHRLVRALEEEAGRRLDHFGPEDVAVLLSSALRLYPPPSSPPGPLLEGCLRRLEALLEEEEEEEEEERPCAPRVLPLLLSGYRLRARARRGQPSAEEKRRILRLVLRRLEQAEALPERAAVDEVLALCAPEAGEEALGALFRSAPFSHHAHPLLVRCLAGCFPDKAEGCTPATVAALARHLARHRLREPPLLDSIAAFLLRRVEHLDLKVIQRLVFPFSRLSYQPPNHLELFPSLAAVLQQRAAAAPLATLNILMSLFQLHYFPAAILHQVFSRAFVANVTSTPCGWIARNYLSLLDATVQLELSNYSGPHLEPQCRASVFHRVLTADGAHCSCKGLVQEALQQLVGKEGYRQETVVPPGYCIDFLLWISSSGRVLPIGWAASAAAATASTPQALHPAKGDLPSSQQERLARHRVGDLPSQEQLLSRLPPQERHSSGLAYLGSPARTKFPLASGRSGAATLAHLSLPVQEGMVADGPQKAEEIHRVVLCVNDKWHYCRDTLVLVGSRAMRNRHLSLLGYHLVQLPYLELEKVRGLEEAKQYLCQKVRELSLPYLALGQQPGRGKEDNAPGG